MHGLPQIDLFISSTDANVLPDANAEINKVNRKHGEKLAYWRIATPSLHYCVLCLQPSNHIFVCVHLFKCCHTHTTPPSVLVNNSPFSLTLQWFIVQILAKNEVWYCL